jgi:hypothetical protein
MFWSFVGSDKTDVELSDPASHVVLIYLNIVHTEYHMHMQRILPDYNAEYLEKLLAIFPNPARISALAEAAGYDDNFIRFLRKRRSR